VCSAAEGLSTGQLRSTKLAMAVPEIDVKEAMRLLEEEMKDDTGIATPRDLMDDFQTVKEMWEEAKNRELSGTCFEMAGQLGYVHHT